MLGQRLCLMLLAKPFYRPPLVHRHVPTPGLGFLGYFYQWGVVNSVSINLHGNHFFFNLLSHRILRCFEIIIHLET